MFIKKYFKQIVYKSKAPGGQGHLQPIINYEIKGRGVLIKAV